MQAVDKLQFLLFWDWRQSNLSQLGDNQWLTVFSLIKSESEDLAVYSSLIPDDRVSNALTRSSWDVMMGGALPGCTRYYDEGEARVEYHRFNTNSGIEPLVLHRTFHGMREPYIEILEEFRLFHNLYEEKNGAFTKIFDTGEELEIVRTSSSKIMIRQKEIRQFLAVKEMHLAIFFEVFRYSDLPFSQIASELRNFEHSEGLTRYDISVHENDFTAARAQGSFSRLCGKKLIPGLTKAKSGIWPYDEEQEKAYEEFIIGSDEDGEAIRYSSNPEKLANFFGANPDAPQYITPVFFRRDVLTKYFAQSEKYSVEDGYLRCGGLWGIRIDNNHPRYVIVYLGDLGRDLPHSEQVYWKSYNVVPDGNMSNVSTRRNILAEFAEPESADLVFKFIFSDFQQNWFKKYNWHLFKPLGKGDEHLFSGLHIPLTDDQSEFDAQVLAITKLMIDSINEDELMRTGINVKPETKGIGKLEEYFSASGFTDSAKWIRFLRDIQTLRSTGVGHRKGRGYAKIAKTFGVDEKPLSLVIQNILNDMSLFLKALSSHFL